MGSRSAPTPVCAHRGIRARHARAREDRTADGELVARSRLAVSQSFATLARVPDLASVGWFARPRRAEAGRPEGGEGSTWSPRTWSGLEARSDLRFFFDVDDGEVLRRDEVGIVLASEDDVPRETRSLLADLAYAALPEGRPRLFIARVRDLSGSWIYEGSARMRPLPIADGRARREI